MQDLGCPRLSVDPAAIRVIKDEVVIVEFAASAGTLCSAVGENCHAAGDALVTGSTGDRWSVSRERFDAKYLPCGETRSGCAGRYRNRPAIVFAKQIHEPFRVTRSNGGDVLTGDAGDWAVEYSPGDCGVVAADRFDRVYRRADAATR